MIITKVCYDCKKEISMPEPEVFDGLVARPIGGHRYMRIWLCKDCRKDAVKGGTVYEEDIDIVDPEES